MNNNKTYDNEIIKDERSKYLIGESESKTKEELYEELVTLIKENYSEKLYKTEILTFLKIS